ncbi:tRNA pseudouridine(13) synthase TruD, partial [Candidatus Woesearchaeota archaeon]|nr:tRNA pseudouridine(13) synthase TruD [Candidatus Woesearchaeota archaeon]
MKIKVIPEDFYVEEDFEPKLDGREYAYFKLKKRNWSTIEVITALAARLQVPVKWFGYCGNKDKNAVTVQYVSLYNGDKDKLDRIKVKDLELEFLGYGNERITLGMNRGNLFKIIIRDLEKEIEVKNRKVLNLFDEQRFGKDNLNMKVGRAIIKKNFKEACRLLDLSADGKDYIGVLSKLDKRRMRFYVNAYQSYLWNQVVSRLNKEFEKVPLIGFLTESEGEVKEIYEEIMVKEGITKNDFMIKSMREISSEGAERNTFIEPRDLE